MLDETEFLAEINHLLTKYYGITFEDTGYDIADWLKRFGDLDNVEESLQMYAEKYDLEKIE